ncbi:MAG: hypothetical protein WAN48_12205 [Actinomycetes bacterium]
MSYDEIPEEIARLLRPLGDVPVPDANPALVAFLYEPVTLLTEKGDLSATAASNVNGPVTAAAAQAAGLPKRRRSMKLLVGQMFAAVSRASGLAKVMLGTGVLVVAGMGSAAAVGAVVDTSPTLPVVQVVDSGSSDADDSTTTDSGTDAGQPADDQTTPTDPPAQDKGDQGTGLTTSPQGTSGDNSDDQGQSADDQGQNNDDQGSTSQDDQGTESADDNGSGTQADSGSGDSSSGDSGSGGSGSGDSSSGGSGSGDSGSSGSGSGDSGGDQSGD